MNNLAMNNLVFIQISYHIFQLTLISLSSLHTHFSNCSHLPLLVQVPHCHCHCYSPTHWDYISMDLPNFSLFFILSDHFRLQIVRKFPMNSLWELTYLTSFTIPQIHVCLMVNLVSLNLTLFLTVHFCAVHGYAALLEFHPLKQTRSTHSLISGLHCLVNNLRHWLALLGCFSHCTYLYICSNGP